MIMLQLSRAKPGTPAIIIRLICELSRIHYEHAKVSYVRAIHIGLHYTHSCRALVFLSFGDAPGGAFAIHL